MKLERLEIRALPGIDPGFPVADLDPGINLVVGPNASGKSSLARAFAACLYPEEHADDFVQVTADVTTADGALRVERRGAEIRWTRHGEPVEPPRLPDHRFLSCYMVSVDALAAATATDRDIANLIAREAAGGYDLREAEAGFRHTVHGARDPAARFRAADDELRARQRAHEELRSEEDRLDELGGELAAAEAAGREVESFERAKRLLAARDAVREARVRLAGLPDGIEPLTGREEETLERLDERRDRASEARAAAEAARADAESALAAPEMAGPDPDTGALERARRSTARLGELERDVDGHEREVRVARARLAGAAADLGGSPPAAPLLDPGTLHATEDALAAKRAVEAEIQGLEARLGRLPAADVTAPDPAPSRDGAAELRRWLALPVSAGAAGGPVRWLVAAGVVVALLAVLAALVAGLWWALLALLLGVAAAVFAWLAAAGQPSRTARRESEERFGQIGLDPPAAWAPDAVRERLRELERAALEAEELRARVAERDEVQGALAAARTRRETERAKLVDLARRVGFDPDRLDASLHRWTSLVETHERARSALSELEARVEGLRDEAGVARAGVVEFLRAHDAAPEAAMPDLEALDEGLDAVAERVRRRAEARREAEAARERIHRATAELAGIDAEVAAVYEGAGVPPGDRAALRHRLERIGEWREARKALDVALARERDADEHLGNASEARAFAELDSAAALDGALDEARARAARRDEFFGRIREIETRLAAARAGRALEDARAARQASEDALRERFDAVMSDTTARFLLERVRRDHVDESRPRLLARAQDWFRHFTRNRFALRMTEDEQFSALDTVADEIRRLDQLSSGTRMQLLLAVRLAWALEAERDREPLPLVLDEALTTSDPERAAAVVDAVRTLAAESNRQIFYLTAQPLDELVWSDSGASPHRIDLAALRHGAAAATPGDLAAPAPPSVPPPGDLAPAEYGALLGVPPVDPWTPASAIHPFHLLRTDLPLVHRLVSHGDDRVGALRSLISSGAARAYLDAAEIRGLEARVALAEIWLEARRFGRGRPVDRAELDGAPAVSGHFAEAVGALADEVGGDAAALVAAIRDGRVPRFRTAKCDELEAWLGERGHIDGREPLGDGERAHRLLSEAVPWIEEGVLDAAAVAALARSLDAGCLAAGSG